LFSIVPFSTPKSIAPPCSAGKELSGDGFNFVPSRGRWLRLYRKINTNADPKTNPKKIS